MRPTFLLRRTTLVPSRPSSSHTPRHRSRRYESHSTKPDSAPIKPDGASKPEPPTSPSAQQPSHSHAQSTSSPTPTPAGAPAASAASTAPSVPARSVPQSLSLRERISAGPLGKFGRSYSRYQEQRPYTTQLVSSLVIYLCGDLSAQYFFPAEKRGVQQDGPGKEDKDGEVETEEEEGGGGYDPYRTLRHLTVGIGSSIPSYNWFMFLHRNFNFASTPLSILTKVVVQQTVFTPVFNTYFFSVHSILSGASLFETYERLKVALPQSIVNSAKFWPAVTAISFLYVPPQFRNVFSGVIAVGWQTYLSWLNQRAAREVEAEMESAAGAVASSVVGKEVKVEVGGRAAGGEKVAIKA